jgi:hypothetical protein
LKIPAGRVEYSLTESALVPFQVEPAQTKERVPFLTDQIRPKLFQHIRKDHAIGERRVLEHHLKDSFEEKFEGFMKRAGFQRFQG